ncbi:MAG: hypothetical protein Q9215_006372 [Flavoplaca cf. flavocitrina]
MLSSITTICFTAALFVTRSLAASIAFGNPTFNTINFGVPFSIQWYGGDGTPVTVILNSGNPAALQPVGSIATSLLSSPYTWTPYASAVVKPGVPYVLSIVQSGLTNYSPVFRIGTAAAAPALAYALHAPVPIGTAGYYPLQKPMGQDNPAVHARHDGTEGVFPRHDATGFIFPRHYATGVIPALPEATPETSSSTVPALPFATDTYYPMYATGSGIESIPAYATGGRYNNVTATGTIGAAAAYVSHSASTIPEVCNQVADDGYKVEICSNGAFAVGSDVRAMVAVVSGACALLLFCI